MHEEGAIHALMARYCVNMDRYDTEAWLGDFIDEAVWEAPGLGKFEGKAAIRGFSEATNTQLRAGPPGVHLMSNPLVTVTGGEAEFRCYMTYLLVQSSGIEIRSTGSYTVMLAKREGGWRIASVYFARPGAT